jgi:hypothetical protein
MRSFEGAMESYLVRIYRKAEDNPRVLVGVVEEVGAKEKKAFNSLQELWEILNPKRRTTTKYRKNNQKGTGFKGNGLKRNSLKGNGFKENGHRY